MSGDLDSLLRRLCAAPGPSGFEMPVAAVFRETASTFATDVRGDALGTSFAVVNAGGSPRVALCAHVDEIGFLISHVDERGMLWLTSVGGWHAPVVAAQRVLVQARSGPVHGVVGTRPVHQLDKEERERAPRLDELWVDIGARDEADARRLVREGDPVVLDAPAIDLLEGRMASRALDNRVGVAVVLAAARLCAEAGDLQAEVVVVGTVQEETQYASAPAAMAVQPDLAVVVDVTHVSDYPGAEKAARGGSARGLGSGPAITRGATTSPLLAERFIELADEAGIPYTIEAEGSRTMTDLDALAMSGAGVPGALIAVPLRYMHSPSEIVQVSDVAKTAELIARFCRSLRPDQEWTR